MRSSDHEMRMDDENDGKLPVLGLEAYHCPIPQVQQQAVLNVSVELR
jgi:hypothetical protein